MAPKLRFDFDNVLIVDWYPCHFSFHHDPFKARVIMDRIGQIRGAGWEEWLKRKSALAPKLTANYVSTIELAYKQTLENLRHGLGKQKT